VIEREHTLAVTLLPSGKLHADAGDCSAKVTTLMRQPLPEYPGHVFVYVLEGSVEMQMESGQRHTLKPSDTFHENPRTRAPSAGRSARRSRRNCSSISTGPEISHA
jgi:hypothetical protein